MKVVGRDEFDTEPEYCITDLQLRLAIDNYLLNLPYSMWADWEIKRPDRRKLAAEWLYQTIREVLAVNGEEGMRDAEQ